MEVPCPRGQWENPGMKVPCPRGDWVLSGVVLGGDG